MKTILAIAALLVLAACDNLAPATGGYDPVGAAIMANGGVIRPYSPPAPMYRQPINCVTVGTFISCN